MRVAQPALAWPEDLRAALPLGRVALVVLAGASAGWALAAQRGITLAELGVGLGFVLWVCVVAGRRAMARSRALPRRLLCVDGAWQLLVPGAPAASQVQPQVVLDVGPWLLLRCRVTETRIHRPATRVWFAAARAAAPADWPCFRGRLLTVRGSDLRPEATW